MILGTIRPEKHFTIHLNNVWSIKSDNYQWILTNKTATYNPFKKEECVGAKETYHASLEQVAAKILKEDTKGLESLDEIVTLLKSNEVLLTKYLKSVA